MKEKRILIAAMYGNIGTRIYHQMAAKSPLIDRFLSLITSK